MLLSSQVLSWSSSLFQWKLKPCIHVILSIPPHLVICTLTNWLLLLPPPPPSLASGAIFHATTCAWKYTLFFSAPPISLLLFQIPTQYPLLWAYFPQDLRQNYCRNPDGDRAPWCYTIDPSVRWEYCNLRRCIADCVVGNGLDYRGTIATTASGKTCQEWNSQKPHSHDYFTPVTHPRAGLERNNYCRNPDGDRAPWCYTIDPSVRWEYCNLRRCSNTQINLPKPPRPTMVSTLLGNGLDYRGTIATTASGKTCQEWNSQKPHSHDYFTPVTHPRAGLERNVSSGSDNASLCRAVTLSALTYLWNTEELFLF
uniref:Kringle domain-containing protein n=1 Tax=Gopherus agassizii TaxID=38772 RepID=A0A452GQD4_9SAUR